MKSLTDFICLVTGASRGIGKGIALQLGEAGATVYITGRTLKTVDGKPGSLSLTAEEIEKRGGKCIPIQCDHSNDDEIKSLFDRVNEEQNGRLDILVNNAYSAVNALIENAGKTYWECPPTLWDDVNNVGLRNHYFCTHYATKLMIERKQGLIINVSSAGGLRYVFNVAYGVGKIGCDRMAADCASELAKKKTGITMVSLWPGAVQTENIMNHIKENPDAMPGQNMFIEGESIEYSGKCVVSLASDPKLNEKNGKILITADLGDEYGLVDIDGRRQYGPRHICALMKYAGYPNVASWIPGWLKIPKFILTLSGSRF